MLVLNRKVGEKICIDGQIVVTVSRIQGRRVSLTIQAPKDVHVVRGELRPYGDATESAPEALPGLDVDHHLDADHHVAPVLHNPITHPLAAS